MRSVFRRWPKHEIEYMSDIAEACGSSAHSFCMLVTLMKGAGCPCPCPCPRPQPWNVSGLAWKVSG
jgi:hypothetical protein